MTRDALQPLRAVFLTALGLETKAILRHLTETEERRIHGTIFIVGRFQADSIAWTIAIAELGAGNLSPAAIGERAFAAFEPHVALFVGVAGGVKDVAIGDVVAGEKIYGYEAGKDTSHGFSPRASAPIASHALAQTARAVARNAIWINRIEPGLCNEPTAFVGAIAAGEKVVGSTRSATARFLRANYGDALAVEMEGRGFMEALHVNPQIQGMVIRGISDLLSGKRTADAAGTQLKASSAAAAFAFALLERHADAITTPARQYTTVDKAGTPSHDAAVSDQRRAALVTSYGTNSGDPDDLIGSDVWKCYETLFPIKEERDDPTNIITWLRDGYNNTTDWAEVFFTLTVDNFCIGMAYVSLLRPLDGGVNRPKGWWFGNYFGINKGWRESGNAIRFLESITEKCESIMPDSKGIVFEESDTIIHI
jgi:nucleoside phosphorylase